MMMMMMEDFNKEEEEDNSNNDRPIMITPMIMTEIMMYTKMTVVTTML